MLAANFSHLDYVPAINNPAIDADEFSCILLPLFVETYDILVIQNE